MVAYINMAHTHDKQFSVKQLIWFNYRNNISHPVLLDYQKGRKTKGKMKITKQDKENLIGLLKEYLEVFKNDKKHQKIHKEEGCPKCELAKELLRKL